MNTEQIFCKKCGGITKMWDNGRKIWWPEAQTRFDVSPDAWCICLPLIIMDGKYNTGR